MSCSTHVHSNFHAHSNIQKLCCRSDICSGSVKVLLTLSSNIRVKLIYWLAHNKLGAVLPCGDASKLGCPIVQCSPRHMQIQWSEGGSQNVPSHWTFKVKSLRTREGMSVPSLGHRQRSSYQLKRRDVGHRSGQSQNVWHFGLGDIGEQNCDVNYKQSQLIGMDSVSDICKYHLLCFVTIIEVKVMSGHQVKKVKQKHFVIWSCNTCF